MHRETGSLVLNGRKGRVPRIAAPTEASLEAEERMAESGGKGQGVTRGLGWYSELEGLLEAL